jgi:CAS/CSE protein, C-terminus
MVWCVVQTMLKPFLQHHYWSRHGNIPALVILVQAYLQKAPQDIVEKQFVQPILGIFQMLLGLSRHYGDATTLLSSILAYLPLQVRPHIASASLLLKCYCESGLNSHCSSCIDQNAWYENFQTYQNWLVSHHQLSKILSYSDICALMCLSAGTPAVRNQNSFSVPT